MPGVNAAKYYITARALCSIVAASVSTQESATAPRKGENVFTLQTLAGRLEEPCRDVAESSGLRSPSGV
jgi:hypothetical protein